MDKHQFIDVRDLVDSASYHYASTHPFDDEPWEGYYQCHSVTYIPHPFWANMAGKQ